MNTAIKVIVISSMLISSGMVSASEEAQQLGTCLTDSLNGKERKNLAKWIFLGMSSHSLIKPYSNVSESDFDHSNKFVGYKATINLNG